MNDRQQLSASIVPLGVALDSRVIALAVEAPLIMFPTESPHRIAQTRIVLLGRVGIQARIEPDAFALLFGRCGFGL
jgi:hypothetical protein